MNTSVQVCAERAHFSKNLHDVTEDFHSSVYSSIQCQEMRVVQSLKGDRVTFSRKTKAISRQKRDKVTEEEVEELYQCVVEADVSFQTSLDVVELHDGHLCCRDGQNVLHTWSRCGCMFKCCEGF